jgi:uncharacterized membrane protein YciS (DUF1049 family)
MDRFQRVGLIVGVAGLGLCIAGALSNPGQFFHSYLFAFLFWAGIALGSTAILMLYHLTGGGWGLIIRRLLESASRTIPLIALLIVPVMIGIPSLYEWSHADAVAAHKILQHKQIYLNVPFFLTRTALYFSVWLLLSFLLNHWSAEQDRTGDPSWTRKLRMLSAPGILLYGLTATFASVDWVMSLEPEWFSTVYGMLFIVGQVLTAMSFMIVVLMFLGDREPLRAVMTKARLNDLGNLMLAFVMLWAYLSFSQYLIIWSANLPEEITWYLPRLKGAWGAIAVILVLFHFALPFLLLLSRQIKRKTRTLGIVAGAMLVLRFVDLFWVTQPVFRRERFSLHWMDLLLPVALGGLWVAFFFWQLKRRPLLAINDAQLAGGAKHE